MSEKLIDIHSHILPYLDDGAADMQTAILMAKIACNEGIGTVIATPHFYPSKTRRSQGALSKRLEQLNALRIALNEYNVPLELLPGFEVNADASLLKRKTFGSLTLAGTKWILLECPFHSDEGFDYVIDSLLAEGFRIVIAHPERYLFFTQDFDRVEEFTRRGLWMQITANALIGASGKDRQHWCLRAIELGFVHLVSSDAHNLISRPPKLQEAKQLLHRVFGITKMHEIMYDNPARLLGRRL